MKFRNWSDVGNLPGIWEFTKWCICWRSWTTIL